MHQLQRAKDQFNRKFQKTLLNLKLKVEHSKGQVEINLKSQSNQIYLIHLCITNLANLF